MRRLCAFAVANLSERLSAARSNHHPGRGGNTRGAHHTHEARAPWVHGEFFEFFEGLEIECFEHFDEERDEHGQATYGDKEAFLAN